MLILSLAVALLVAPQDAPPADAPRFLPADVPVIAPATSDPGCDGDEVFQGATCLLVPSDQIDTVVQAYVDQLYVRSWLDAGGEGRFRIFIRRREGGGCDGMQMLALDRGARGLVLFSAVPGNACAANSPLLQEGS